MKYRTKAIGLRLTLSVMASIFYTHKKLLFFKRRRCSANSAKISLKFTDKVPFLAGLSVSKAYLTDKPSFSGDLSVNFRPLCWGFTDKSRFLDYLSVKTGPKRLNFYGRTAIFDHFVRNRYFSGRPFTDRVPIFIDVSVNGRSFAKCSAR